MKTAFHDDFVDKLADQARINQPIRFEGMTNGARLLQGEPAVDTVRAKRMLILTAHRITANT